MAAPTIQPLLRFRAEFVDPSDLTPDRPVQILSSSMSQCETWANKMLAATESPLAWVDIYETIERRIRWIRKPKPKEEPKP